MGRVGEGEVVLVGLWLRAFGRGKSKAKEGSRVSWCWDWFQGGLRGWYAEGERATDKRAKIRRKGTGRVSRALPNHTQPTSTHQNPIPSRTFCT